MKTVHMLGNEKLETIDVPEPEPKDDKVVVKVMSSMICGVERNQYYASEPTSEKVYNGGHESAGIVSKVDKAGRVKEGDHVTVFLPFTHCHRCPACLSGEWLHCWYPPRGGGRRLGAHSQYLLVPDYLCLPMPEALPFDHGALIGDCLGTPYRAIKRLGVNARDTVFVTGAGPIGAATARILKYHNARVIVSDINDYRLQQVAKKDADYVFNPERDDVLAKVKEITNNRGADISIECSGVEAGQVQCLDATGVLGKVGFLGNKNDTIPVSMTRHFTFKELSILGSWASTPVEHFEVLGMIERGMEVDDLITHRYGIDDAPAAFKKFFDGEAVKVALHPWDE